MIENLTTGGIQIKVLVTLLSECVLDTVLINIHEEPLPYSSRYKLTRQIGPVYSCKCFNNKWQNVQVKVRSASHHCYNCVIIAILFFFDLIDFKFDMTKVERITHQPGQGKEWVGDGVGYLPTWSERGRGVEVTYLSGWKGGGQVGWSPTYLVVEGKTGRDRVGVG